MYNYLYPRPSVTCDVIVMSTSNPKKILLIKRGNDPFKNHWALPGGFIEMEETLEQSALRELREETGLDLTQASQFKTYGDPGRDPRGRTITIVFSCQVDQELKVKGGDDASEALWFNINNLPPLAFDHKTILDDYLNSDYSPSSSY